MKKIMILSSHPEELYKLAAFLIMLFPECRIESISGRTESFEVLPVASESVTVDNGGKKNGEYFNHPFGMDTFHNNLYILTDKPICLIFTGKNATEISQEQCNFF